MYIKHYLFAHTFFEWSLEICLEGLLPVDVYECVERSEGYFVALFSNNIITPHAVQEVKEAGCAYHESMKIAFGSVSCTVNTHVVCGHF